MPTWAWILLAVVLAVGGLGVALLFAAKNVVATIRFHEQIAPEMAAVLREAIVFTPQVEYFTRPDDYGWLTIYVIESPDWEKFVKSVRAQLRARTIHRTDCQCPPEASG